MHNLSSCDELVFTKYIYFFFLKESSILNFLDGPSLRVWTYFPKLFLFYILKEICFLSSKQFLMPGPWDIAMVKLENIAPP
jgi:hypothetical protein